MKVRCDTYGSHDDGYDVITVCLDTGEEVGAYSIVESPKEERQQLDSMIRACIRERVAGLVKERRVLRAENERLRVQNALIRGSLGEWKDPK